MDSRPLRRGPATWPVRATSVLLLLQALGLVAFGIYYGRLIDWRQAWWNDAMLELATSAAIGIIAGMAIAMLLGLAAAGVLLRLRRGWFLAMLLQGALLFACLVLYVRSKPIAIYPLMFWCILLVLYLNSDAVREAFRIAPVTRQGDEQDER